MSFQLTILDFQAKPILAGVTLDLIGDGAVLAKGIIGNDGCVSFDANVAGVKQLAVRVDAGQGAPAQPNPAA